MKRVNVVFFLLVFIGFNSFAMESNKRPSEEDNPLAKRPALAVQAAASSSSSALTRTKSHSEARGEDLSAAAQENLNPHRLKKTTNFTGLAALAAAATTAVAAPAASSSSAASDSSLLADELLDDSSVSLLDNFVLLISSDGHEFSLPRNHFLIVHSTMIQDQLKKLSNQQKLADDIIYTNVPSSDLRSLILQAKTFGEVYDAFLSNQSEGGKPVLKGIPKLLKEYVSRGKLPCFDTFALYAAPKLTREDAPQREEMSGVKNQLYRALARRFFLINGKKLPNVDFDEGKFSIKELLRYGHFTPKKLHDPELFTGLCEEIDQQFNLDEQGINNLDGLSDVPGIRECRVLCLNYNELSEIHANDFKGMTEVTHLILNTNNIEKVHMCAFDCLPNLEMVDLVDNPLTKEAFRILAQIRIFRPQLTIFDDLNPDGVVEDDSDDDDSNLEGSSADEDSDDEAEDTSSDSGSGNADEDTSDDDSADSDDSSDKDDCTDSTESDDSTEDDDDFTDDDEMVAETGRIKS